MLDWCAVSLEEKETVSNISFLSMHCVLLDVCADTKDDFAPSHYICTIPTLPVVLSRVHFLK